MISLSLRYSRTFPDRPLLWAPTLYSAPTLSECHLLGRSRVGNRNLRMKERKPGDWLQKQGQENKSGWHQRCVTKRRCKMGSKGQDLPLWGSSNLHLIQDLWCTTQTSIQIRWLCFNSPLRKPVKVVTSTGHKKPSQTQKDALKANRRHLGWSLLHKDHPGWYLHSAVRSWTPSFLSSIEVAPPSHCFLPLLGLHIDSNACC